MLVCVEASVTVKLPVAFLKARLPSRLTKPKTSRVRFVMTASSTPSSPSMSSTTSAVSGPVAMVTLAAVVSVVLIVSSLFTKSRTVFGAVRLLVLFTSTDKVFT